MISPVPSSLGEITSHSTQARWLFNNITSAKVKSTKSSNAKIKGSPGGRGGMDNNL